MYVEPNRSIEIQLKMRWSHYAKDLCQNCYMKHYGKEKRKENRNAKAAARLMIEPFPVEKLPSEKASSKKSTTKRQTL